MDGEAWKRDSYDRNESSLSDMHASMGLDEHPSMTRQELFILRSIAITAASISLASGLLVGYWFIKMKRSFRHHLIMLLICSDFWKASWQLIYPAVVFTLNGKVDSGSAFCQVTGFFMSMGIEASDFAVLVIAVHSALYIFRPGTTLGEGGLFRYRFYLYGVWVAFPLLMASLAFINPDYAYNSQGTYCYLPARPIWVRLALAWVPRYLILLMIIILYASIYIYVRLKFRTFRTNIGASTLDVEEVEGPVQPTSSVPRLPELHSHGLIPPESPRSDSPQATRASDQPFLKPIPAHQTEKSHSSTPTDFRSRSIDGVYDFPTAGQPSFRSPVTGIINRDPTQNPASPQESTAAAELRRRRYAISRQLRLLFIYPVVYALMWVPPLISHSLQYTDYFAKNPSFALQCLVSFTLPVQCAVDCWLFATREKPWKYIPHSGRRTFWVSFMFWKHNCNDTHGGERCSQGLEDVLEYRREEHRSNRGMGIEARAAYKRREDERQEAEQRWLERRQQAKPSVSGDTIQPERKGSVGSIASMPRRPEVSWWDRYDVQGGGAAAGEDEEDEEDEEEYNRGRGYKMGDLESGERSIERETGRSVSSSPTAIGSRSTSGSGTARDFDISPEPKSSPS